jgi:adenosine deaminase
MPTDFATALELGDWESLRRAPKADLHIHGFGGGDRAFIRERTGVDIAPVDRVLGSMAEMHAFAAENLVPVFQGVAGRALALEATFVQARKDGVTRLEVGMSFALRRLDRAATAHHGLHPRRGLGR